MKPRVFVSHAWGKDNLPHEFAKALVLQLRAANMDAQIDEDVLVFGDVWRQVIRRVIDAKDTASIVLLSPEYMTSPNCRFELGLLTDAAYGLGKPIIPVLLRKFDGSKTALGDDVLYQDLSELYTTFRRSGGHGLSAEWRRDFRRHSLALKRAIERQYSQYLSALHIVQVTDPRSPVLEQSSDLYEAYPSEYRDPWDRVISWLTESTIAAKAKFFPIEIYLVAS